MKFSLKSIDRRRLFAYAAAALIGAALIALLCVCLNKNPGSYPYPTYLLQAKAWLRGEAALDRNYEYLELAIFNDRYFVSFPPVPSIPMVLWALIFGDNVPGGLFQKAYVILACLLILSELLRSKKISAAESVAWAILICFASALLPISTDGAVWYEAQTLAFLFSVSAIIAIRRRHLAGACIWYALSVGCRPMCVCMGPVLLLTYLEDMRAESVSYKKAILNLLPGIFCGLVIAAAYGWYNYIRFGNPLEFGHNHLPEFTSSAYGQFNLHYVWGNLRTVLFGAPFSLNPENHAVTFNIFGFSMFLSCPILICQAVWFVLDVVRRRMTPVKWTLLVCGCVHLFLLLMHKTPGGFQFGYRYAIELIPYAFAWLILSDDRQKMTRWESVILCAGLLFNLIGSLLVHF